MKSAYDRNQFSRLSIEFHLRWCFLVTSFILFPQYHVALFADAPMAGGKQDDALCQDIWPFALSEQRSSDACSLICTHPNVVMEILWIGPYQSQPYQSQPALPIPDTIPSMPDQMSRHTSTLSLFSCIWRAPVRTRKSPHCSLHQRAAHGQSIDSAGISSIRKRQTLVLHRANLLLDTHRGGFCHFNLRSPLWETAA